MNTTITERYKSWVRHPSRRSWCLSEKRNHLSFHPWSHVRLNKLFIHSLVPLAGSTHDENTHTNSSAEKIHNTHTHTHTRARACAYKNNKHKQKQPNIKIHLYKQTHIHTQKNTYTYTKTNTHTHRNIRRRPLEQRSKQTWRDLHVMKNNQMMYDVTPSRLTQRLFAILVLVFLIFYLFYF